MRKALGSGAKISTYAKDGGYIAKKGKKIYNKIFTGQGSPKRLHWRRGHWRRITDRNGNTVKRTWIEEQKVGNPELGTIIHDYVLKSRKQ